MFTVLMPTLNAMPYLDECLGSLARQSRTDFEVYAWDNGSTDGSLECLQQWIPNQLPGKVISGKPLPLGPCRAALINAAPTEICALIDADDRCAPNRFESQLEEMQKHPAWIMLGAQVRYIDSSGELLDQHRDTPLTALDIRCAQLRGNAIYQTSVILKKAAALAVGNFRDLKCEDYDLQLRIAARYPVANLPDALMDYRLHKASTSAGYGEDPGNQDFALQCLAEHAPTAYGISGEVIINLRRQRYPYAFPYLKQIAQTIASQSSCRPLEVYRSPHFNRVIAFMQQASDWRTSLQILLRQPKDVNWLRRLKQILRDARKPS